MSEPVVTDRRGREQRDPRGATQLLGWTAPDLPQIEEWDATAAFRFGYAANVVAYRCVQLRAGTAASVPFVAGRRLGDTNTIVERSPLARLLGPPPGGPAPKLSARKLMRWTHAQRIVTGRRAWEIETDEAGTPVAFWPLASSSLRAKPSKSGTEWFRVFEYGQTHDPVKFKPEDVFYGWDPSGVDFRQAESPLQAARFDLTLVNLCDRYGIGFLRNNAVPAAIVTTTAFPNEDARRAFAANWRSEFRGPDNAGRVAINEVGDDGDGPVGDSIDVKVLGLSAKDSQLTAMRKDIMNEIAMAIGVPWSKLDASGRTFSNADAEDRTWWEETILPDLVDLADDINMQLAPRLGSEIGWFDLRGVPALRRKHFAVLSGTEVVEMVKLGVIMPNEVRVDSELEPRDGLDEPLKAPTPPPVPVQPPQAPPALPPAPPAPKALPPARTSPVRERRIVDPALVEQRRANIWRNADASARTLEGRWERAWRRLFVRQGEATLARLTGKRGRQALERRDPAPQIDPATVFDQGFWRAAAEELSTDLYEATAADALGALALRFGIAFDVSAPYVDEFIRQRAHQLAGQVTTTTYEAIRTAMVEGVTAGESVDDIAVRIRHVFTVANDARATTIARTEVISAFNGAAALGAAQLPGDVVAAQEWIATRDSRTRDAHASADGQIVAIGQPFTVGGRALAYPGDPNGGAANTVNCFPAETVVAGVEIEGSYRRWYEGDMVTVWMRSGRTLTGTPNHPVLTNCGWVALGELDDRHQLVHARVGEFDGPSWMEPHVRRAPTAVSEVHDALALMGAAHRVAGAPVDFHGDGMGGKIDVVRADGLLRVGDHALVEEQRSKLPFAELHLLQRLLSDDCFAFELRHGRLGSAAGDVRGSSELSTFVGAGVLHADSHSGRPITRDDASIEQSSTHAGAGESDADRDRLFRLAREVSLHEIVAIDVKPFAGHVYNLQTASGWYIANGIVTHNCRCTAAFLTPEEFTAAAERSKGRSVELRTAQALLAMVPVRPEHFDFITWRRAVEEVSAA